jgi:hypothetical protein
MLSKSINPIVRFVFSIWAASTLARTIPAMIRLKAAGALPDRSNRYRDFFLKRIQKNEAINIIDIQISTRRKNGN